MYTIFDEYFICLVHDILNDQLNEDNTSQLIPVEDTEFVYRNLTIPRRTTFDKKLNIVVDGETVNLSYISFNHDDFKNFLENNIKLQAFDGISANIGRIVNVDNLTAEIGSRLSKIVSDLEDSNIPSSFSQVYYENDVKNLSKKIPNTFALARFNVGFLKQHGIKVLRTANNTSNPHVLIVSEKLEKQVSNYIKNNLKDKKSNFDILNTNEQNYIYDFLKNIIYDDIKTYTYVPLSYNPIDGKVIRKNVKIKDMEDMGKHCVFTSIFHRTFFDNHLQTKHLTHSVCYNGSEFIIYRYDSAMDEYIFKALQNPDRYNVTIIESFRSFLERKGILESLYK